MKNLTAIEVALLRAVHALQDTRKHPPGSQAWYFALNDAILFSAEAIRLAKGDTDASNNGNPGKKT